jgi:sulfide:quinone oxidoreductase
MSGFRVVICGGGIAATEGLLRLRKLAGDAIDITVVAPNEDLVMRPLAVAEPFSFGKAARYDLARIVSENGAELVPDSLSWVDPEERTVHTKGDQALEFDALLIAIGARQVEMFEHTTTFYDAKADDTLHGVIQDIEGGYTKSVAFLLPDAPAHPLPIYELALMTAERASSMGMGEVELTLITPDASPLAAFGANASAAVSGLLTEAGITTYSSALAQVPANGQLIVQPQGQELSPGRIIAMPGIEGPGLRGIPGGGSHGFVPIDKHCCVPGTQRRIYAAGDAAAYPIKHGGLGSQMADSAAAAIATLAGVEADPEPFHPVIRGKLLNGRSPLFLSAKLVGASGFESEVFDKPPWPEDEKVVAAELGPYLAGPDAPRRPVARSG